MDICVCTLSLMTVLKQQTCFLAIHPEKKFRGSALPREPSLSLADEACPAARVRAAARAGGRDRRGARESASERLNSSDLACPLGFGLLKRVHLPLSKASSAKGLCQGGSAKQCCHGRGRVPSVRLNSWHLQGKAQLKVVFKGLWEGK